MTVILILLSLITVYKGNWHYCSFDADVCETVSQKRMGHKSVRALHQYECVTTTQNQLVANVLQPRPYPTDDPFDLSYTQEDLNLFAQLVMIPLNSEK